MGKILSDIEISANLQKVISMYDEGEKALSKELNITTTQLKEYVAGKRRAIHLSPKMLDIGISSDWYLTGKGEMRLQDVRGRDKMSSHYEKMGRTMYDALKDILRQEEKATTLRQIAEDTVDRKKSEKASIPLYLHAIAAGPPADSTSPVEEYLELPKRMIAHPKETYAVTACGDSMTGAGIEEGDILIVDYHIEAQDKSIVIASINGEQTVKRLWIEGGKIKLMPENSHYDPIEITKGMHFKTQGVVIWVIRRTG